MADAGRVVSLVLCRGEQLLGTLPPVQVELPWWPEVSDIVAETRRLYGIDVVVLRLLQAPTDRRQGGQLTYLAETNDHSTASLQEWLGPDPIADQPHRQAWARPGGRPSIWDGRLHGWWSKIADRPARPSRSRHGICQRCGVSPRRRGESG